MKGKNIDPRFFDEDGFMDDNPQSFQKIKRKHKINKKAQKESRKRDSWDDDWN